MLRLTIKNAITEQYGLPFTEHKKTRQIQKWPNFWCPIEPLYNVALSCHKLEGRQGEAPGVASNATWPWSLANPPLAFGMAWHGNILHHGGVH